MIICYTFLEIWYVTYVIVVFHFGQFFDVLPPNNPKDEHFKKMKKACVDIIILHNFTKNYDYRLYCS